MFPFSAIASSVKKLKDKNNSNRNKQKIKITHPIDTVSKEQFFKWQEEGKCGCCGAESGEYAGICDECRFS